MHIFKSLLLSLLIDFVLAFITLITLYRWPSLCFGVLFFVVLGWPMIWFCIIILQMNGNKSIDMIKMQNYYNLDALRRNSDRMNNRQNGQNT